MKVVFYLCEKCGNVVVKFVDSGVTPDCCGQPMHELVPNISDGAGEKHVPVVKRISDDSISVKVGETPHPMTGKHYIRFVCVVFENRIQTVWFQPDDKPECRIHTAGDKVLAVYEYCNLHGLWMTDKVPEKAPCTFCFFF